MHCRFRRETPCENWAPTTGGANVHPGCRRRLSTTLVAQRGFLNRKTLRKIEKGDAGVSIGGYASLLFVLGMTDRLGDLADARFDRVGLTLEEERLPKRVRARKKERAGART